MQPLKRTALNTVHHSLGATMMTAASWDMPAVYSDMLAENEGLRTRCALTDFSSMGQIEVQGPQATEFLDGLAVNNVTSAPVGRVVYSSILKEDGRVLDDVTIYRLGEQHYMMVTSTAKHDTSWAWAVERAKGKQVYLSDMTPGCTLTCLQGPKSRTVLQKLTDVGLSKLGYFWAVEGKVAGLPCLISRTGFTGELGYELYHPAQWSVSLWEALTEAGKPEGILPVGIRTVSATVRLEKAYMAGAELEGAYPLELPIAWTVRMKKPDFVGKAALAKALESGITRTLVGFEVGEGVPKAGAEIKRNGATVGKVTSAGFGPTVKKNIALGFVPAGLSSVGEQFQVIDGAKILTLTVVPTPIYDPAGARLRG